MKFAEKGERKRNLSIFDTTEEKKRLSTPSMPVE
jgi:hypothetical protein